MSKFRSVWMGVLIVFFGLLVGDVHAKVYQVAPELLKEVKANKAAYLAAPSADTVFELAMSYAYTGQIEKGWATLKKIPDFDQNYSEKVIKKYSAMTIENPKDWKSHFKLAFGYYFEDKKDLSIQSFRRVLEIEPKQVWALGFIALIKGDQGKIDEAVAIAKDAIKMEPNAAALHFLLGAGYLKQGNYLGLAAETLTVGRLKTMESIVYGDY